MHFLFQYMFKAFHTNVLDIGRLYLLPAFHMEVAVLNAGLFSIPRVFCSIIMSFLCYMFFEFLPELVIRQYSNLLGVSLLPSFQACLLCCKYFQHLKGPFKSMKNVTLVFCLSSVCFCLAAYLHEMN